MYNELYNLLVEGLSGASRAYLNHERKQRKNIELHNFFISNPKLKNIIPTKRKRNNIRLRKHIHRMSSDDYDKPYTRNEIAHSAKSYRKIQKKSQID